jgi:cell division septal protein FtsQ
LVLGGLVYFLFFSNFFRVEKIVLVNNKEVNQEEIESQFKKFGEKKRFFVLPADSIFILNKESLGAFLLDSIPNLKDVSIEKKLLNVLKIKVKEKQLSVVWVSGNKLHYVDQEGKICCQASLDEVVEKHLPIVYDVSSKQVSRNEEVMTSKFVGFLQELYREFPEKISVDAKKFWVPSVLSREIHLETQAGWKVYFNVDRTVESQLNDLKIVIDEQIKGNINSIKYIDLRVENWIYYK